MKHFGQDDSKQFEPCQLCEALVPDAVDGLLTEADQQWFERHLMTCAACSEMMADAQRGAAWLEMLKTPRPEPGAALLERILAQTSGAAAGEMAEQATLHLVPALVAAELPRRSNVIRFPQRFSPLARLLETRLAMTAAMAFFSIALTLNLTGVRLHASDLKPANVRNTLFQAQAQAHRSYDNWRVVRVLTSRVESLRDDVRGNGEDGAGGSTSKPETSPKPEGSSRHEAPTPAGIPVVIGEGRRVAVAGGLA